MSHGAEERGAEEQRRIRRATAALLAVLLCLYTGAIAVIVARDKAVDFALYYLAARGFAQGEDVYALGAAGSPASRRTWDRIARETGVGAYAPPYRYPPLTAALVWPLTALTPRAAAIVWLAGSSLALIASAWLLGRSGTARAGVPLALALLAGFVPALVTLYAGQVNALVLLTLCCALYCIRRQWLASAGAAVAVGGMLKLVPFAHLAYLAWRRQWRALIAGSAVAVGCIVVTLPLVDARDLLSYARSFLVLSRAGQVNALVGNQALSGIFARWLTDAPNVAWWLTQATTLGLVAATAALCWPVGSFAQTATLEFALVTTTATLVSPSVWYHQYILLLLPLFVLADTAVRHPENRWMLGPLTLGYLATGAFGIAWRRLETPLLASLPLYMALMLWILLARLLVRAKTARPAVPPLR